MAENDQAPKNEETKQAPKNEETKQAPKKEETKQAPKKGAATCKHHPELLGKFVIIRTNCVGVWLGVWDGYREEKAENSKYPRCLIRLLKARRIWEFGSQNMDDVAERGIVKGSTAQLLAVEDVKDLEDKSLQNPKLYRVGEIEDDKVIASIYKAPVHEHPVG